MAQTEIPISDHIARRATRTHQIINPTTKAFEGLSHTFFELKVDGGETALSCFWLEYFSGAISQKIRSVRAAIKNKLKGESDVMKIIILNVGTLKKIGEDHGVKLRISTVGQRNDPSYSQIFGMPRNNQDSDLLHAMAADSMKDAIPYVE